LVDNLFKIKHCASANIHRPFDPSQICYDHLYGVMARTTFTSQNFANMPQQVDISCVLIPFYWLFSPCDRLVAIEVVTYQTKKALT